MDSRKRLRTESSDPQMLRAQEVSEAGTVTSQPSVYSPDKKHALYLWIELSTDADPKEVLRTCKSLQTMVDIVSKRDESDEILAGVGFGPTFFKQIGGSTKQNYVYAYRRGGNGELPSSRKSDKIQEKINNLNKPAGDVFVHAKCNTFSKVFELAQQFMAALPKNSVKDYADIYGFEYRNSRDLSGFIDGTENPTESDRRKKIAVEPETGGSYVVTQKWVHNFEVITTTKVSILEAWVGRTMLDSTELQNKRITAHIARMTGGNAFQQKKAFEIVRQSMPYGTLKDGAGLFFIAYSASPDNLNFMLDDMVGAGKDGLHYDDIMLLSKNVKGTYWYFPGQEELANLG